MGFVEVRNLLELSLLLFTLSSAYASSQQAGACSSLESLSLVSTNSTVTMASYLTAGSNTPVPGSCQHNVTNTVNVCRVYGVTNTSSTSSVRFEIWLPDVWYGRFLGTGNGGLQGCIDYTNLDYGTSLHFATIGGDAGHDGFTGLPLLHNPESIRDFSYRSVHVEATVGKQIVEAYYSQPPSKSYYFGCSAGGRQGIQSALLHPDDFDGIVGGSPAIDWNHMQGAGILRANFVANGTDRFIPPSLWASVAREVLRQCDALDGLVDSIIADPDECDFDPTQLLCQDGQITQCLTKAQVDALQLFYKPIYDNDGTLLWPRLEPGSEIDQQLPRSPISGLVGFMQSEWLKYTIYNDSSITFNNFSIANIEFMDTINPGGIATWNGNLSAFRNRGGKFLTFHGSNDITVPLANSKRYYELVASTLSLKSLDDFYRLFLIPGMFHCQVGGAWKLGQGALTGIGTNVFNDTEHNIVLAMVDWVEKGIAPQTITGVDDRFGERVHCRYPQKSTWNGSTWICIR